MTTRGIASLERYLEQLYENTKSASADNLSDPIQLIQDIKDLCFSELTEDEYGDCSHRLFSPSYPYNVCVYLTKTHGVVDKSHTKPRLALLKFMQEYVELRGSNITEHVITISAICFEVFRIDVGNTVKVEAVRVIATLLEGKFDLINATQLRVSEMTSAFLDSFTGSKIAQTLRGVLLRTLGIISRKYPKCVAGRVASLLDLYKSTLKTNFHSKKPERQEMAGALEGLNQFLINFSGDFVVHISSVREVFGYLSLGVVPPPGLNRYEVARQSLNFFAVHSTLFAPYITEDAEKLYNSISSLFGTPNKETRNAVYNALRSIMQTVAFEISTGKRNHDADEQTFQFFLQRFFKVLDSSNMSPETNMAIRGLGQLACATRRFLNAVHLRALLDKIIEFRHRMLKIYSQPGVEEDKIRPLSSFFQAYADIILQLDDVDDAILDELGQLTGLLFGKFPVMFPSQHRQQYRAFSRVLVALYSKGDALGIFISKFCYSALMMSCVQEIPTWKKPKSGARVDVETREQREERESRKVTARAYEAFLPLWRNILKPWRQPDLGFPDDFMREAEGVIYDGLIHAILQMLQNLNLNMEEIDASDQPQRRTEDDGLGLSPSPEERKKQKTRDEDDDEDQILDDTGDDEDQHSVHRDNSDLSHRRPVVPEDFNLFLNLVDFCRDLLSSTHESLFCRRWVYVVGERLIKLTSAHPNISGFYKLLETVFRICERQRYFANIEEAMIEGNAIADPLGVRAMELDRAENALIPAAALATNRDITFLLFQKFSKEVVIRMKQFRDELLASAVRMTLALPRELLDIPSLVPSLNLALSMGLSYEPLALAGIEALERWMYTISTQLSPCLHLILPSLNTYLKSAPQYDAQQMDIDPTADNAVKVRFKNAEGKMQTVKKSARSISTDIQFKIIKLLGMMGGEFNTDLVSTFALDSQQHLAWDQQKPMALDLFLGKVKSQLHLDEMLPRIAYLAENDNHRQTKVAACELLHSVMVWMIGSNATRPNAPKDINTKTAFHNIYERLFPVMIRLATSSESVAHQLFWPLSLQCVHWFAHIAETKSRDVLLDAIISATGDEHSSSLRQAGAALLSEYFASAISNSGAASKQVALVFTKIYEIAHDSSPHKRVGAALSITAIHKVFRVHKVLVLYYALELMHESVECLRRSHADDPSLGTCDRIEMAIGQVANIVKKRANLLTHKLKSKKHMKRAKHRTLGALVAWLFECVGRPETRFRRVCMTLFHQLSQLVAPSGRAPELNTVCGPNVWLEHKTREQGGLERVLEICDPNQDVCNVDEESTSESLCLFMESLARSMDTYTWLFSEQIANPLIFAQDSTVFKMIVQFIRLLYAIDKSHAVLQELTPAQALNFFTIRSNTFVGACSFLLLLLRQHAAFFKKYVGPYVITPDFARILLMYVADPTFMGLPASDHSIVAALREVAGPLCRRLAQLKSGRVIITTLGIMLVGDDTIPKRSVFDENLFYTESPQKALDITKAFVLFYRCGILSQVLQKNGGIHSYVDVLVKTIFDVSYKLNPVQNMYAARALSLCLALGYTTKNLVKLLRNKDLIVAPSKSPVDDADEENDDYDEYLATQPATQAPVDADPESRATTEVSKAVLSRSTRGAAFYLAFQDEIDAFLLSKWTSVSKPLVKRMGSEPVLFSAVQSLMHRYETRDRKEMRRRHAEERLAHLKRMSLIAQGATKLYQIAEVNLPSAQHEQSGNTQPDGDLPPAQLGWQNPSVEAVGELLDIPKITELIAEQDVRAEFIRNVSDILPLLSSWVLRDANEYQKKKFIGIADLLLKLDSSAVLGSSEETREFLFKSVTDLLDRFYKLPFKLAVLDMVSPLLIHGSDHETVPVVENITKLVMFDFPIGADGMERTSAKYMTYTQGIDKLLRILQQSKDIRILKLLLTVIRDSCHPHIRAINTGIAEYISVIASDKDQSAVHNLIRFAFDVVENPAHDFMLQYIMVTKFVIPLLEKLDVDSMLDVVHAYILKLSNLIEARPKVRQGEGVDDFAFGVTKTLCAFDIVREFYRLVPVNIMKGIVNEEWWKLRYPKKKNAKMSGTELITLLLKSSHDARQKDLHPPPGFDERLETAYYASAFNCIGTIMVRTQHKENLFVGLIFKEAKQKGCLVWERIIDTSEVMVFPIKTKFKWVHKPIGEIRPETDGMDTLFNVSASAQRFNADHDVRYISSQYLANSSLDSSMQDAFQPPTVGGGAVLSPFGSQVERSEWKQQESRSLSLALGDEDDQDFDHDSDALTQKRGGGFARAQAKAEFFELDRLNENPCMPTLLQVIDKLVDLQAYHVTDMPQWMTHLLNKFKDPFTHINIKYFIAKVVLNRHLVFLQYADKWTPPLLRIFYEGKDLEKGGILDYFLRDVVLLFVRKSTPDENEEEGSQSPGQKKGEKFWDSVVPPRQEATDFCNFLATCLFNSEMKVVRDNLQLFKALYDRWKRKVNFNLQIVVDLLTKEKRVRNRKSDDKESARLLTLTRVLGLQLLGVVVANGADIHDAPLSGEMYHALMAALDMKSKSVYESCAELVGKILNSLFEKYGKDESRLAKDPFYDRVKEKIISMFTAKDFGKALKALEQCCAHYDRMAGVFLTRIFAVLNNLPPEFKVSALRLIDLRLSDSEDAWLLIQPHMEKILVNRNDKIQALALKLVHQIVLMGINEEQLPTFKSWCITMSGIFPDHLNPSHRIQFYSIFMEIWENYDFLRADVPVLRVCLLKGLTDAYPKIRAIMTTWWNQSGQLSEDPFERTVQLLQLGYHPDVESKWLSYGSGLLLRLCANNVKYQDAMFTEPLDPANEPTEFTLDTSYTTASMPMAPMFSSSVQSSQDASLRGSVVSSAIGSLSGTGASGAFGGSTNYCSLSEYIDSQRVRDHGAEYPTLGVFSNVTYDSSVETDKSLDINRVVKKPDTTMGKFLAPAVIHSGARVQAAAPRPHSGRATAQQTQLDNTAFSASQSSSAAEEIHPPSTVDGDASGVVLVRRYQDLPKNVSTAYSIQTILSARKRQFLSERSLTESRRFNVSLTRKYRIGTYPDVQIKVSDLLEPLYMLATHDDTLSAMLFTNIVHGLHDQLSAPQRKLRDKELSACMMDALNSSVAHSPFVNCILRVCLGSEKSSAELHMDNDLVGLVSARANAYHSGVMLLEHQLRRPATKSKKKKQKGAEVAKTYEEERLDGWSRLGNLYKSLGETDFLMAVLDQHIATEQRTRDAIRLQINGNFEGASKSYDAVIKDGATDVSDEERSLWEDGRLECLVKMCSWEDTSKAVLDDFGSDGPNKIWHPDFEDYSMQYLRLFMISGTRVKERWPQVISFLDEALIDRHRANTLITQFGTDLVFMAMTRQDWDRARSLVTQSMSAFVERWSALHPFASRSRVKALDDLQRLFEMDEVLKFINSGERNFRSLRAVERLLGRWADRWPSITHHPMLVWDGVVNTRLLLLNVLQDQFASFSSRNRGQECADLLQLRRLTDETRIKLFRKVCTAASKQRNYSVAMQYERKVNLEITASGFEFEPLLARVKLLVRKKMDSANPATGIEGVSKCVKLLSKRFKAHSDLIKAVRSHEYETHLTLAMMFQKMGLKAMELNGQLDVLSSIIARCKVLSKEKPANFAKKCFTKSYNSFQNLLKVEMGTDSALQEKAQRRYGMFCDMILKQNDQKGIDSSKLSKYANFVMEALLKAVNLESPKANNMMPRLLGLLEQFPSTRPIWSRIVQESPLWVMLPWVSFMTSALRRGEVAPLVIPILTRLAQQYPAAVYYPFHMSIDERLFPSSLKPVVKPLENILKCGALEDFMKGLLQLQHAHMRLSDHAAEVRRLEKVDARDKRERLKKQFMEMVDITFNKDGQFAGVMHDELADYYKRKMEPKFGVNGEKISNYTDSQVRSLLNAMAKDLREGRIGPTEREQNSETVGAFCHWLAAFDASVYSAKEQSMLEIPGQYEIFEKPRPETHIRISGIGVRMITMKSIRRPKKLEIIGSDQKTHSFLIKHGEDLRGDQRVMQLFRLMNGILGQKAPRLAQMKTFSIVPMTLSLGILEWVPNSCPLLGLFLEHYFKKAKRRGTAQMRASKDREAWLAQHEKAGATAQIRHGIIHTVKRGEVLDQWKIWENATRPNALYEGVRSVANSPEAFVSIRTNFIRSLATFSISSYLLGIGDRHLDNFLLDMTTGHLVGIDFGHAFGTATQFLPVPELVPFRLTRQLEYMTSPIGKNGVLFLNMVSALEAFRGTKSRLLSAMNIYLREPTMDWLRFAQKLEARFGAEATANFARDKLDQAALKLDLCNPVVIVHTDLEKNPGFRKKNADHMKYVKGYKKVATGGPDRIRSQVGRKCESVEQQVECLIDLATDPDVLARMYSGWSPIV